jgi:hypothetical protein
MALALTGSPQITAAALDAAVNAELNANWLPRSGVSNGSDAAAGQVGEYVSSTRTQGAAIGMTSSVALNVTSISLTAGDWDVSGVAATANPGSTVTSVASASISTTSGTMAVAPDGGYVQFAPGSNPGTAQLLATGTTRISVSGLTTVYLVINCAFSVSTLNTYGILRARRIR